MPDNKDRIAKAGLPSRAVARISAFFGNATAIFPLEPIRVAHLPQKKDRPGGEGSSARAHKEGMYGA